MRILLTGGGTREPIDGVRFITNFSTGKTAAALADAFASEGHAVTLIAAESAVRPKRDCRISEFVTFDDLDSRLRSILAEERFDLILHLAAVSDYSVASIEADGDPVAGPRTERKVPSGASELTLRLKPTFKIVDRLRDYARDGVPRIVAFKLTRTPSRPERLEAVRKLSSSPAVDLVVHNDLGDRERGAALFTLYAGIEPLGTAADPESLSQLLLRTLERTSS